MFLTDRIFCACAYNFLPLLYRTIYGRTLTPVCRKRCQLLSGAVSIVPHLVLRTAYVRMLVCPGVGYSTPLEVSGWPVFKFRALFSFFSSGF